MITTVSIIVLLLTLVFYLVHFNYRYWKRRGVRGPKPTCFVGNLAKSFKLKAQPGEIYTDIYREYNKDSVVGIFKSFTPALIVRDPDLIKEITIKSFNHFQDNDLPVDKKADPLFGRHPFVLKGEEWKVVRAQLTPGFTSGKMKWLYPYLEANSKRLVRFLETQSTTTNGEGYEAKELCTRFTLNNVADAVFGVEGKCFDEDNSEFRQLARGFLSPGSWAIFAKLLVTIFPVVSKVISIRFCPKPIEKKLIEIVSQTLKHRQDNNIVRNDFLHIMNELKTTCKEYDFTDIDVTAHAAGFFGDGYETSSNLMSSVLFQLASHPDAQSKLRDEITKAFEGKDNLSYEILQSLLFLDGVIYETLRTMPPMYFLMKLCTKDFTFTLKETNKPVTIDKKTPIIIPTHALQHDPAYFPDPELFKPERFIGANKDNIRKCTFMPFGEGPRACLGQRFGTLQIKLGITYIVKNYEIGVNRKTKLPLTFDPANILVTPVGGLWLDFRKLA